MRVSVCCASGSRNSWPVSSGNSRRTLSSVRSWSENCCSGRDEAGSRRSRFRKCGGFAPYVSLPFDGQAADEYSIIRTHLTNRGQLIGHNDLLIAAIALANGVILVTHNTAEFSRAPGLLLEDWQ